MYRDWMRRWITELPQEVKRTYMIATLLHPCFKTYNFIEGWCALIPATVKVLAVGELRIEWATVWKPWSTSTATPAEGETIDLDLG